jgi:hypothetical protein
MTDVMAREAVLEDVRHERRGQDAKWGEQNHPDGTGGDLAVRMSDAARRLTDAKAKVGRLTWKDILREEYLEALAETDPAKLRTELIQVAAVATAWVEAIDRRS